MNTKCQEIITEYEVLDMYYAKVIGKCRSGIYLEMENNQQAFAYNYLSLLPGSEVLCSILRKPKGEKGMLVSIDSVLSYGAVAA